MVKTEMVKCVSEEGRKATLLERRSQGTKRQLRKDHHHGY